MTTNSFFNNIIQSVKNSTIEIDKCTFIIPNKRASNILKSELSKIYQPPFFAPVILSIEEFIEEVSEISILSELELLCILYNEYCHLFEEKDEFDVFSKWAKSLLGDFNEIDRHLIDPEKLFNYLSAIKEIENDHWSINPETEQVKNYIKFWNKLFTLYKNFKQTLFKENKGYQGLQYRKSAENIKNYLHTSNSHLVFAGFNALNTSEEKLIKTVLELNKGDVFWDIDKSFVDRKYHSAGLFIRKIKEWKNFSDTEFKWLNNEYTERKNINIYSASKNTGQSLVAGNILRTLNKDTLDKTALVLADESLLSPLLNYIPNNVESVNITMGNPISNFMLSSFFNELFNYQTKVKDNTVYFKDILPLLHNSYVELLTTSESTNLKKHLTKNNISYVSTSEIYKITNSKFCETLFRNWNIDFVENLHVVLQGLDELKHLSDIERNLLNHYFDILDEIKSFKEKYPYLKNLKTFIEIFKTLENSKKLDFVGSQKEGLQVMGLLETRSLEFENLIITSVNEGILPGGKTNNSFIPFDVKIENNLPTYKDKDAVYAYHFYRLISKAKNIHIIYNSDVDVLEGGEKSRFIAQIEVEDIHNVNFINFKESTDKLETKDIAIQKEEDIQNLLKELATKGYSPSSLSNYIRNPLDFYSQSILKIKDPDVLEETIAFNTLGTIVHNTLEDLYKPLINSKLQKNQLDLILKKVDSILEIHIKNEFKYGDTTNGKNLIIKEVAKKYITTFINSEIEDINKGNEIIIRSLEKSISTLISIPGINYPIKLKGMVDRIDEYNGTTRVIDYKTGKVEQTNTTVTDWELILSDYKKYSKSFQILTYVYMLNKENNISLPVEGGIISFRNTKDGFIKFNKKETSRSRTKETSINQETLHNFESELFKLILEIHNPEIPFTEKEVD